MAGIIVGVDGSDHSRRALGWAMREAVKHRLPLTVVSIHPPPARPATSIYWGVHSYPENSFDPELARMAVQEFVDKVAGRNRRGACDHRERGRGRCGGRARQCLA